MKSSSVYLRGILVCVFMCACAFAQAEKRVSEVKHLEGWVEYALPGSDEFLVLELSTPLPYGSRVRTAEDGKAIIRVVPGAAMQVAASTTVTLDGMEFEKEGSTVLKRKARISLSSGTVSALIDHRDPKATDFRIETPQGSAAARGTFYGVSVMDGQTFVSVKEGKVGVAQKRDEAGSSSDKPAKE